MIRPGQMISDSTEMKHGQSGAGETGDGFVFPGIDRTHQVIILSGSVFVLSLLQRQVNNLTPPGVFIACLPACDVR